MKILRILLVGILISQLLCPPSLRAEAMPYQLVDRNKYSIFKDDTASQEKEYTIPDEEPDDADLLKYTEDFWKQAVTEVEGSYLPDKAPEPIADLTLLNPTLSLPLYGTSLSLTGRYVLGFKMESMKRKSSANTESTPKTSNTEMLQELQLKMQGKIMDRVFVDIDYDDQREQEKTLSVAYRGKKGEFIQSAEFGDIDLSLPQTEFIAYQKQLFGAKMHLQYKNANLYLIGSQTKGSSKQKQFVGGSVSEIVSLADTSYIRRTYYDLTFGGNKKESVSQPSSWLGHGGISAGTEEIYYYSNKTSRDYVPVFKQATDFATGDAYPNENWELLVRGNDYTIDYAKGIIRFKRSITSEGAIGVDYRFNDGTLLSALGTSNTIKIIKTENDKSFTSSTDEVGYRLEMKTFYSLGATSITPDDGKGNFIFQVLDANGQEIGAAIGKLYPSTIDMDFDEGVFQLKTEFTDDPSLYNATPVSTKNRLFKIQYESKVKTYFIESGMVVQSEKVKLNGATLTRNTDYYIDYTSGYITFYKGDSITENSVIDITYDTLTGSDTNNSVMGGRLDYTLLDKVVLGATVLKESGEKPETVPQVGAYSKDLLVYGTDINGKDIKLAKPLAVDFSAEIAKSQKNQNLFGYAMIDNMSDAEAQVSASTTYRDWQISSNPNGNSSFLDSIHWDTQEIPVSEINRNAVVNYDDKQEVLVINYDFSKGIDFDGRDEVSIVYPISTSGVDLSEKTSFELTMLGEAGGPDVNFAFGNVDERSDNSAGMKTACSADDNAPKTEDVNCRNTVSASEDIGWLFTNPDGTEQRYDPFVNNTFHKEKQPNGRVDTQDLNGNGRYDSENIAGNFGYDPSGTAVYTGFEGHATNTNWQTWSVPFTISDKNDWTSVRNIRITLKKGANTKGQIKIANVGLSGVAWNTSTADNTKFSVSGINNIESANYEPIFNDKSGDGLAVFNNLYGSIGNYKEANDTASVQDNALQIKFNTSSMDPAIEPANPERMTDAEYNQSLDYEYFATRNYSSMDLTQHKEIRFLLHGDTNSDTAEFFLKIGSETNFDKIIVPVNFEHWRQIVLKMVDTDGDGFVDALEDASNSAYGVRINRRRSAAGGYLNLQEISMIKAGIQKKTGASGGAAGEVWLNVIHLAESITLEGEARKVAGEMRLDGWGTVGAKYKYQDSNFETPLSVAKKQEVTDEEYYLKVTKIQEFPMSANFKRSTTVTPTIVDSSTYNTVSLLDKGRVEREEANIHGDFIKDKLPKISLDYTMNKVDYDIMQRKDSANTYSANLTHNVGNFKNISAGYYITDSSISYDGTVHSETYYNTDETTHKFNVKTTYQPNSSFTFTPTYSLSKSKEERTNYSESNSNYRYPKAQTQNTGFNSTWKIAKWFAPTINYNINTVETNNLSIKTATSNADKKFNVGEIKTINRTANGGVSLTLNASDLLPNSKLFNTFVVSSGYRIQDADSWADVDSSYDSKKALWVRSSLKDIGSYGYLKSMTLRDTITSTQRWSPFAKYEIKGHAAPLRTVSVINNFTKTLQDNAQTGTEYSSSSLTLPDLTFSISDLEQFFTSSTWISSSNLKLRYSLIKQEDEASSNGDISNYGGDLRFMLFNYFDTVLNYNRKQSEKRDIRAGTQLSREQDNDLSAQTSFYIKSLRVTPKVLYNTHEVWRVQRLTESSKELTPSITFRWDFNIPKGFRMPIFNKIYKTSNRIIWNTTLSYSKKSSPVEVKDNYNKYDVTSSLDYELSQNLRFTLSGGLTMLDHAYVETEDYTAYNVAANLTVHF